MLTIGITWEKWTPKIESSVVLDALKLGDNVYWYADPEFQDATEIAKCKRVLKVANVKLQTSRPPLGQEFDAWKVYYEDERPAVDIPTNRIFYKCVVTQGTRRLVLRPNAENYPTFPVVERPAPPSTLPQYKPMPNPNQPSLNTLPRWAWTN